MPVPSCLPDGSHAPQDDIQCLYPRESMAVAAPREKDSFIPKRLHGRKKPSMHLQTESTNNAILRTYLVPITVSMFRVGCCMEGQLRELLTSHHPRKLPSFPQPTFTALSSAINRTRTVKFPTPIPLG